MRRGTFAAFAVALLVFGAGCSSVFQERTPPVTRTPYGVPGDTPRTSLPEGAGDIAPGLQSHALRDPRALTEAHARILSGQGFDVHYNRIVYEENGSIWRGKNVRVAVAPNRTRFYISVDDVTDDIGYPEAYDDIRYWSAGNGSPVLRATHDEGPPEYSTVTPGDRGTGAADVLGADPTFAGRLYELLSAIETVRVSPTGDSDRNTFVVRALNLSEEADFDRVGGRGTRDVALAFLVTEEGLLNEIYLSYSTTVDGRELRVVEQYRFLDIGNPVVYTPVWEDDARAAIDGLNRSAGGDAGGNGSNASDPGRPTGSAGGGTGDTGPGAGNSVAVSDGFGARVAPSETYRD